MPFHIYIKILDFDQNVQKSKNDHLPENIKKWPPRIPYQRLINFALFAITSELSGHVCQFLVIFAELDAFWPSPPGGSIFCTSTCHFNKLHSTSTIARPSTLFFKNSLQWIQWVTCRHANYYAEHGVQEFCWERITSRNDRCWITSWGTPMAVILENQFMDFLKNMKFLKKWSKCRPQGIRLAYRTTILIFLRFLCF